MSDPIDAAGLLEGTTPGPWTWTEFWVNGADGHHIAGIAAGRSVHHARLIAAAPVLAAEVVRLREALAAACELLARSSERIDLTRNNGGPALRYDIGSFLDARAAAAGGST